MADFHKPAQPVSWETTNPKIIEEFLAESESGEAVVLRRNASFAKKFVTSEERPDASKTSGGEERTASKRQGALRFFADFAQVRTGWGSKSRQS